MWTAFALLPLSLAWSNGPLVDQSRVGWDLYHWGEYVLGQPLPPGSTILADSEKVAPLYYLGHVEGRRPDVETMVLGNEEDYLAELNRRVVAGQPTYLARYLPGLAGQYRLYSQGPLVQVTTAQAPSPQMQQVLDNVSWGNHRLALLGYDLEEGTGNVAYRLALYWTASEALDTSYHIRVRLVGTGERVWWQDEGTHPVRGYNPTVAWKPGEIVADYHEIPADPAVPAGRLKLEVGVFLPFRSEGLASDLTREPWYSVASVEHQMQDPAAPLAHTLRASYGGQLLLTGASDPGLLPPGEPLHLMLEWSRIGASEDLTMVLRWTAADGSEVGRMQARPYDGAYSTTMWPEGKKLLGRIAAAAPDVPGRYTLHIGWSDAQGQLLPARCSWAAGLSQDCPVATLLVEGNARGSGFNFGDQVVLLGSQLDRTQMRRGELLEVNLRWQGLRSWDSDHTVFVHLIGPDGKVHGQVDQWPVQGTLATTQWTPGRIVDDPYVVRLSADAPAGTYQVEVGWYLLGTLRRLPVLDGTGQPVEDHIIIGSVAVEP